MKFLFQHIVLFFFFLPKKKEFNSFLFPSYTIIQQKSNDLNLIFHKSLYPKKPFIYLMESNNRELGTQASSGNLNHYSSACETLNPFGVLEWCYQDGLFCYHLATTLSFSFSIFPKDPTTSFSFSFFFYVMLD